jgi:hypothetical protein
MTTLEKVRAKIIEAVPEIGTPRPVPCPSCEPGCLVLHQEYSYRPITLADVLRAMKNAQWSVNAHGTFWRTIEYPNGGFDSKGFANEGGKWNLALPLDEQEPEVIEFLHKILCV